MLRGKVMKHMTEVKYEAKNEKCDMHLILVPETENRGEAIFKEIMAVNFAEQINGKKATYTKQGKQKQTHTYTQFCETVEHQMQRQHVTSNQREKTNPLQSNDNDSDS